MDATIHLVRHGEVENPKGVIYGRMPGFHLSDRGRRQTEAAADRLAERGIGTVWASPLERAQETAAVIAARHGIEVVTDERLIESDTNLEGVGRNLLAFALSPKNWWSLRNPWRPTWGESFPEIRARMLSAITDAVAAAADREMVLVSHQTPVLVARQALTKRRGPPWLSGAPCSTGSVTTVVMEGDRVSVSYFAPPV